MTDTTQQELADTGLGETYRHRDCGAMVIFDMSGGFCTRCHAENLDGDDILRMRSLPFECRCGQTYDTQRELLAHFTRRPTRTHQAARAAVGASR